MSELVVPRKEGTLVKRSENNTLWKSRYVVLSNYMLLWYKSKEDTKHPTSILLDGCIAAPIHEQQFNKKHCFQISSNKFPRLYHFQADNEAAKASWIDNINKAAFLFKSTAPNHNQTPNNSLSPTKITKSEKKNQLIEDMPSEHIRSLLKFKEEDRIEGYENVASWRTPASLNGLTSGYEEDDEVVVVSQLPKSLRMENASCFAVHNSENIFVLGQNNLSKKSSIQIISARKAEEWNFTTDPLITSSEGISDISFLNSVLLYGTSFGKVLYYKCSMNGSIRSFNLEQTFLPVDQNGVNLRSNQSHLSKSYLQSYKVAKVRLTPLTTDAFFCVENNRFHFWNIKNPEKPALTSELTSHGYICSAEWNLHAPSQFASGSSHGSLSLFDLRKIGKNASKTAAWKVSDAHSESIRTISWNPSSAELIASASDDGTIKVWDIRVNKDPLCVLQGHLNGVSCLSWHPKNVDVLVSGSLDRTVRLWNLRVSPHYQIYQHDAFSGHSIGVGYIGGSGGLYACASSEGEVFVGETSESFLK